MGLAVGMTVAQDGPSRPPVILITIDTLRADYLGCYGHKGIETPVIDGLAKEGILFQRAYCQVPITPPSHASILTGVYPATHGVRDFTSPRLRPGFPTLATLLRKQGYKTGAFVSAHVLNADWGLDQGFDTYYDRFAPQDFAGVNPGSVQRNAAATIDATLEWLKGQGSDPYFLWVHLFDPHHDYSPPEPFRSRYAHDLYAGEVAYVDRELGRLVLALKQRGDYEKGIFILTSDHGESLGEHGELEHGFFLYDATLRIPLIIKLPASYRVSGRQVKAIAETVDIAPTVLQILGKSPDRSVPMEGVGLLSVMLGKRVTIARGSYAETLYPRTTFGWSSLASFNSGKYKYIEAPRPELYDLSTDPDELDNVIDTNKAIANQLREQLRTLQQRTRSTGAAEPVDIDPDRLEALRSLGYVAVSEAVPTPRDTAALADPKDKIETFNIVLRALQASDAGALQESNRLLRQVLASEPSLFIAHYSLGMNLLKAGKAAEALDSFTTATELNPSSDLAQIAGTTALAQLGRLDEAILRLRKIVDGNPNRTSAKKQLALMYSRKRDFRNASEIYQEILAARPDDLVSTRLLGIAQVEAEEYSAGMQTLTRVLNQGAHDALTLNYLGTAQTNLGLTEQGIQSYKESLSINPGYQKARLNLSFALLKSGAREEAATEFAILCKADPGLCRQYRQYFP